MGWRYWEETIGLVAKHEDFHADRSVLGLWHPEELYQIIHDFGRMNTYDKPLYGSERICSCAHSTKTVSRISPDPPTWRDRVSLLTQERAPI